MTIAETKSYKYLGDMITSDGKNTENLKMRKTKLQGTTISINSIASSEVLNQIETLVLLELHEKISISSLLTNAESWTLNKGEEGELEYNRTTINQRPIQFTLTITNGCDHIHIWITIHEATC